MPDDRWLDDFPERDRELAHRDRDYKTALEGTLAAQQAKMRVAARDIARPVALSLTEAITRFERAAHVSPLFKWLRRDSSV